jgi:putative inorganic carbon (hco3(-)) transporter
MPPTSHEELFTRKRESKAGWAGRGALLSGWEGIQAPMLLVLLLISGLSVAWLITTLDIRISVAFFVVLVGVPLILYSLFNIVFALGLMLVAAVGVVFGAKYTSLPLGTVLDLLILVSATGILLRQIRERDWRFLKHPLSYMVLIWLYYNILQVLNPEAGSRMAWLYTVRSVAIQLTVFFIGAYALRGNRRGQFALLKLIFIIGAVGAVYGLKQHFFGLSAGEMNWVMADQERYQLYFQWGLMRVPSFCYDPTTFGILMACFGMFCVALLAGPTLWWQKILLGLAAVLAIWAMAYSGTRTAFVLIPAGGVFYAGLTLNRRVFLIGLFFALLGGAFILKSSSSGVIYRIQSAFRPSKDDSMNLRLANQKRIQPYIQQHPFGGGLGSCGVWGQRFNPGSELASFPHDSSFVRMAVELGWIGLILYTLLHYFVLRTGLYYYIRCRDPFIKALYAGVTTWCFMLAVACYAQEAILQQPTNVIYNILLALLVTMHSVTRH